MEERIDEVIKQYNIEVDGRYRVKGMVVLETSKGACMLHPFRGSVTRLGFMNRVLLHMRENGYNLVDLPVVTKEGEWLSQDEMGNRFLLKHYHPGEEISLREENGAIESAINLARVHVAMEGLPVGEDMALSSMELSRLMEKHNRELKRVRAYIREKKVKSEFEVCVLNSFDAFYHQAEEAVEGLKECGYYRMLQSAIRQGRMVHGDYTYHNICRTRKGMATGGFEHCGIGLPLFDLYYLLRKTMEKNQWNSELGLRMIAEYSKVLPLSEEEHRLLYVLFCYPEKYWKILNYYYNSKKSWISSRNLEKLEGVKKQQSQKDSFVSRLYP